MPWASDIQPTLKIAAKCIPGSAALALERPLDGETHNKRIKMKDFTSRISIRSSSVPQTPFQNRPGFILKAVSGQQSGERAQSE